MPITKVTGVITYTPAEHMDRFLQTGVMQSDQFAVVCSIDATKQMALDPTALASDATVTIAGASGGATGTFSLPATAGGTLALAGGAATLQYAAPLTGVTVTISAGKTKLVLEPAGTLDALTVVLPTAPADGTSVNLSSTAIITALTLSGGGSDTVVNAITTLAAAGSAAYVYRASTTKWYRIG